MSLDALTHRLDLLMARRRPTTGAATETFGERLARLRKDRGLTQVELAERLDISQPVLSYYEKQSRRVPPTVLVGLAETLAVTVDELLGRTPVTTAPPTTGGRLLTRLRQIEMLPPAERKAILKILDGLLARQRLQQQRG
jgi:transcriptional regulator with XRE-family HTH domain